MRPSRTCPDCDAFDRTARMYPDAPVVWQQLHHLGDWRHVFLIDDEVIIDHGEDDSGVIPLDLVPRLIEILNEIAAAATGEGA